MLGLAPRLTGQVLHRDGGERTGADLPLFREKRINDPARALKALAAEAKVCTRCDLYKNATQTVFGEGPADAALMLIGEQPGDQEDLAGRPFVGPAGKVLDRALEAAGIERAEIYITNAVKHFKNEPRGKRRLTETRHQRDRRLPLVARQRARADPPAVAVALGATAARALMRKALSINANRGRLIALPNGGKGLITVHPSYLLRLQEERDKRREFDLLVKDLHFAAEAARKARA